MPISDLCDEYKIQPSMLYTWQKAVLENASRAFDGAAEQKGTSSREAELARRIEQLEAKLAKKDAIIAEILDGFSRAVVHWEIREAMREADVETILQRGRELHPSAKPRVISDNGPQFIARDFKEFVRIAGMTHVRSSPYYPQSNGKIERWHCTIKTDAIRRTPPASVEDARKVVATFVDHYNNKRLHSAIGFVAPADALGGHRDEIWAARDRKLEAAREARRVRRAA